MTAVTHYHHPGLSDDLVIVGYPGGFDSGVVLVHDASGAGPDFPECVTAIEPVSATSTQGGAS